MQMSECRKLRDKEITIGPSYVVWSDLLRIFRFTFLFSQNSAIYNYYVSYNVARYIWKISSI